jgi:rubredoxin-NAD+ reductase
LTKAKICCIIYTKIKNEKEKLIMKYECICGYVYDETEGESDNGIAPGTKWDDITDDYACPLCGLGKDEFTKID